MSNQQGYQPTAPYPTDQQENAMSYPPAPYPADPYAAGPVPAGPYAAGPVPTDPYAAGPVATDPGRTLGIVGLVLSVVTALVGLVVSIVALRRSRKAGFKNGFALAGIVVGGLVTLAWLIGGVAGGVALGHVASVCQDLGPGTHEVNGVTYTCG